MYDRTLAFIISGRKGKDSFFYNAKQFLCPELAALLHTHTTTFNLAKVSLLFLATATVSTTTPPN